MPRLYKDNLRSVFGNFFENGLGVFFGNVPWNFTTSHCKVHHAVNGGMGDSFYEWDFVRCDAGERPRLMPFSCTDALQGCSCSMSHAF